MSEQLLWEKLKTRIADKQVVSDLYDKESIKLTHTVSNQILVNRRSYFIKEVKAPIQKRLEKLSKATLWRRFLLIREILKLIKKYPEPTFENTRNANTQPFLKIWDTFFEYENNEGRKELFKAIRRISVDEFEHDLYYASRRDVFIELIIIAILNGTWQPRLENEPDARWWKEPKPYGGKHSIVYKLWKHREEIKRILES